MSAIHPLLTMSALLLLAACQPDGGSGEQVTAYDEISQAETLHFSGNEPFWNGSVTGTVMTYTTPVNPDGIRLEVQRFAGNGGLGYSGHFGGQPLIMTVSPGKCADTMADRTYPFVVIVQIDGNLRDGCGWTDRQPFSATDNP